MSPAAITSFQSPTENSTKKKGSKKTKVTWDHEATNTLISLWSEEPCLYQTSLPEYRDKEKRLNAITRIKTRLESQDIVGLEGITTADVSSKMHSLKVYFCATRTKAKASRKSGAGTDEIYHIRWPFYEPLSFLNDSVTPKSTTSNLAAEDQNIYDLTDSAPSKKAKRKIEQTAQAESAREETELMRSAVDYLRSANSETSEKTEQGKHEKTANELFCDMLAKQLTKMEDGAKKEYFKLEVQRLLFGMAFPTFSTLQSQQPQNMEYRFNQPLSPTYMQGASQQYQFQN